MAANWDSEGPWKAKVQFLAFSHLCQFKASEINEDLFNPQRVIEKTTLFSSEWESFQNRKLLVLEQFFQKRIDLSLILLNSARIFCDDYTQVTIELSLSCSCFLHLLDLADIGCGLCPGMPKIGSSKDTLQRISLS